MKCIVGLGNPGREYERTPHNAGFDVVDRLASSWSVSFKRSFRFPARLTEHRVDGEKVMLVKPMTFMNRSGQAVGPIARKHGVEVQDILVVVDDASPDDTAAWLEGEGPRWAGRLAVVRPERNVGRARARNRAQP